MREIVDLQMREIAGRLAEHDVKVELTDAARDWLAQEGYDPQFGARPLRRTLQRFVENPLSKRILAGEFHEGDTVVVDAAENAEGKRDIVFKVRQAEGIAVELPVGKSSATPTS